MDISIILKILKQNKVGWSEVAKVEKFFFLKQKVSGIKQSKCRGNSKLQTN